MYNSAYAISTSTPIPPKWIPVAGYADYHSGGKRLKTPVLAVRAAPASSSSGRLDSLSSTSRYVLDVSVQV